MIAFILLMIELLLLRYWVKQDLKYGPPLEKFERFLLLKGKKLLSYLRKD